MRVPIMREVGTGADNGDPDHIRGAKIANLLFGTDYGEGDVVEVVYLESVRTAFFEEVERQRQGLADNPLYRAFRSDPTVVCVNPSNRDLLPEGVEPHDQQPPTLEDR